MSNTRHLAPVPDAAPAEPTPSHRAYTDRIELPTGNRPDVDGLLRELCRHAFRGAMVGFELTLDGRLGLRCFVSVRVSERFTAEQLDAGHLAIRRALVVLGVVTARPQAAPAPQDSAPPTEEPQDGAASPPPPSPQS